MSQAHLFAHYTEAARTWVKEVSQDLSVSEEKAARIIRVVLHALRNQIPIDDSFHLLSQLPIIWKGIYVDGWKLSTEFKRLNGMHGYIQAVREEDRNLAGYDFGNDVRAQKAILSVWKLLANHVSENEIRHICHTLPEEIGEMLLNSIKATEIQQREVRVN